MPKRRNQAVETSSSKRDAAWLAAHQTQMMLLNLCSEVPRGSESIWEGPYRELFTDLLKNGASFSRRFEGLSPLEKAMEVRNGGPLRIFIMNLMVDLHPRPDEKLNDLSLEVLFDEVGKKYPIVHKWDPVAKSFINWDAEHESLFMWYLHALTQGVLEEIISLRDWFYFVEPHVRHPPVDHKHRQYLASSMQQVLGLRLV